MTGDILMTTSLSLRRAIVALIFSMFSLCTSTAYAAASRQTLLTYLQNLKSNSSKHLLIGQHTQYWDSNPMDTITSLANTTGKYPAILGTTINAVGSGENGVTLSNQWLNQGGIVLLSWWPGNPHSGVFTSDDTNLSGNFSDLLNSNSQASKNWYASLDQLAAKLKQINGPVLFRPFLELNGGWFWWGNQNTSNFIKVWQNMHDYLVNTKGVSNLLWVYCINAGVGKYADYYPGSSYVDVVSMDAYPPSAGDSVMVNPLSKFNKPLIYAEADEGWESVSGVLPSPYTVDVSSMVNTVLQDFPSVVGIVTWSQSVSMDKQLNADAAMNNSHVITRDALPSGL
jgi:mannan endo-1,4-beta-mannosidase